MDIAEKFFNAFSCFPPAFKFSKDTEAGVQRALLFCRTGANARIYLSGALFASALLSLAFFILLLFIFPFEEAFAALLMIFGAIFSAFLFAPRLLASRREMAIEGELPFFLREMAIYLEIGLPFEKCIERAAKGGYAFSPELLESFREIKSGATVQEALSSLSARCGSLKIKRSLLLLSSIYETGKGIEALKRTAEELSATQLSEMRTGSGKFSMLAIAFIAVSALLPSFFAVFAAASPSVLESAVPIPHVFAAYLLVFPMLVICALAAMSLFLPPGGKTAENEGGLLPDYLRKHGLPSPKILAGALFLLSLALCAIVFSLGEPILAMVMLSLAPAVYALASYFAAKEVEGAELLLPDALYAAASTHRLFSSEKMLSFLAKGGFGRISESFEIALRRQKAGESFSASLDAALLHCPSVLVARAFSLLKVSYETGADMYFALREAASDFVSFFALVRERSALLAVQRYTVLASASALVPIILGTVIFLAPSLSQEQGSALVSALRLSCQAYLLINSALSSLFLALSESKPARAALYFAFSAPISEALFAVFSSGAI